MLNDPVMPIGTVSAAFVGRAAYQVMIDGIGSRTATAIKGGVPISFQRDDRVALARGTDGGWYILGKAPPSTGEIEPDDPDDDVPVEEDIAKEQDYLNSIVSGANLSDYPNFRAKGETPVLEGETGLQAGDAVVSIFSDGSILSRVSDILLTLWSASKNAIYHAAKMVLIRVIPGIEIRLGTKDMGEVLDSGAALKPKVSAMVKLASDPDKVDDLDFYLEMGDLPADLQTFGKSQATTEPQMLRGIYALFRRFGAFEIDNERNEVRFTMLGAVEASEPSLGPYQVRINDREIVLSKGSQFISLTDKGLMIKADRIGLAGPIDMWDPAVAETFKQDTGFPDEETTDPTTIKWYKEGSAANDPGILVTKSVYFGDEKEPAILKGFLEKRYKPDMQAISLHAHTAPTSGGKTTPMSADDPTFYPNVLAGTADAAARLWLSLVRIQEG